MAAHVSTRESRRHFWRLSFLLLVVVPFLPEITIYLVAALAEVKSCQADQANTCFIGPVSVSNIIAFALRVGAGLMVAAWSNGNVWFFVFCVAVSLWIFVCFAALTLGWTHTRARLRLALAVTVVFAVLPYFGPLLAIGNLLNQHCQANEGGVGPCVIFGGSVGTPAHDAMRAGWVVLAGAPISLVAFLIYAIVARVIHKFSGKDPVRSAQ